MTASTQHNRHPGWRYGLLAGVATLAVGLGGTALAQQPGNQQQRQATQPGQAPSQQAGSQAPVVVGQLRTAEQALRQAQGQLGGNQQAQVPQARTAIKSGMVALNQVPEQARGRDDWRNAQRELTEAQQALEGNDPDRQKAAGQLREAADALAALAGQLGGSADAGSGTGHQVQADAAPQAPRITVQQAEPRITVTQQPPQVTVRQPPPQVTIQQPEPRVTVQQAQPRVQVQQAEPRVTVQQQGEPEVIVQRPGQPQVNVQRPDGGPNRDSADQRTGATSAQPAPTQSGGNQAQPAAMMQSGGVALQTVESLVGTNVVGANGRDAGEVRNLLIDGQNRVRAAVVEWGGFLGIGTREAMVPIERIQLGQGEQRARLAMTREELEALPRYDDGRVGTYAREQGWGAETRLYR